MDTFDIIKALKNENHFVGCFARDKLPFLTPRPAGLVINTAVSSHPGEHWVCYYVSAEGQAEYFDPLGDPIPDNEILEFVMRNTGYPWPQVVRNTIAYQHETSMKCGEFCVYYLKQRLRGRSSCEIHAVLSRNSLINDSLV